MSSETNTILLSTILQCKMKLSLKKLNLMIFQLHIISEYVCMCAHIYIYIYIYIQYDPMTSHKHGFLRYAKGMDKITFFFFFMTDPDFLCNL